MVSSMMGSMWYLDSGASFHMTENKKFFGSLEEKDLQMHIEIGENGRYKATGVGTITFKRESDNPLTLKYVMCVHGLKKNFVYVVMLEGRGYDVIFNEGKAFLRHTAMKQVKNIGVQVKNLYKLDVDDCATLSS